MSRAKNYTVVGTSLGLLAEQLEDGWSQLASQRAFFRGHAIHHIVVAGMGGSHLAPGILRAALGTALPWPITIIPDYDLPAWVDRQTLVVCSSYSGTTEETISFFRQAQRKKLPIAVITSGGTLARLARSSSVASYTFSPAIGNPSGQPRLGLGYSLAAFLRLVNDIRPGIVGSDDMTAAVRQAKRSAQRYSSSTRTNPARRAAQALAGRMPLLLGPEWAGGNLHAWANQIHENAKTFAAWYCLPDLNHHLMEGLRDRVQARTMSAIMVTDPAATDRGTLRRKLTEKILTRAGIRITRFKPSGATRLAQAVDLLAFGGYVSWYLAGQRQVDPTPIPTVDFLKHHLARG